MVDDSVSVIISSIEIRAVGGRTSQWARRAYRTGWMPSALAVAAMLRRCASTAARSTQDIAAIAR
jgi:hypothetical protein